MEFKLFVIIFLIMSIYKKNVMVMKLFTYEIIRIYPRGKFSGSKDKNFFLKCLLIAGVKLFFQKGYTNLCHLMFYTVTCSIFLGCRVAPRPV